MKFIDINKNLKQKIENVYNLVGEDYYLIRQAIINIKAATIMNFEEFNYQKVDAEKIKASELDAMLSTLPVGNDYRLVVLNNPSNEAVKFINKYEFYDGLVVVCVNATNLSVGEKVDCSKLDRIDINRYVLNYLSKVNLSIEERALDYLIDATNSNMSRIVSELGKVTSYAVDSANITLDMVVNIVSNTSEYVIYMLTKAIDDQSLNDYHKILNDMSKSLTYNEIFSYLGKYFRRMFYVSINKDDTELSKILAVKPYAIKMSRQSVAKNKIKYYISLYEKYINLDFMIKSGKISAKNALYELVF